MTDDFWLSKLHFALNRRNCSLWKFSVRINAALIESSEIHRFNVARNLCCLLVCSLAPFLEASEFSFWHESGRNLRCRHRNRKLLRFGLSVNQLLFGNRAHADLRSVLLPSSKRSSAS